jgi:hypothetical protein
MVKTSKPKKCHKKSEKRGRISKKIKFIRHPNKTQDLKPESPRSISTKENTIINPENNAQIEYSLLNWSIIFLQQISCPLRNNKEFIQNFINIIKNLCINKNEFISWTMYIEFFLNKSCRKISWDKETLSSLLYIAIYTKKILDDKSKNNYGITINEEKMSEIESILDKKNINLIELNQKYNYYDNFTQKKQKTFYDFKEIVEYIYKSNNYKNVKKIQKTKDKKETKNKKEEPKYEIQIENAQINPNLISNQPKDEVKEEDNIFDFDDEGLFVFDNKQLPVEDYFGKLDDSYENCNKNIESLYYIKQ